MRPLWIVVSLCTAGSTSMPLDGRRPPPNLADQVFVDAFAENNSALVAAAQVCADLCRTPQARAYGAAVTTEYSRRQERLMGLMTQKNLRPAIFKRPMEVARQLAAMDGDALDAAFMAQMVKDHALALDLLKAEVRNGADHELRVLAAELIPSAQQQLNEAVRVEAIIRNGH